MIRPADTGLYAETDPNNEVSLIPNGVSFRTETRPILARDYGPGYFYDVLSTFALKVTAVQGPNWSASPGTAVFSTHSGTLLELQTAGKKHVALQFWPEAGTCRGFIYEWDGTTLYAGTGPHTFAPGTRYYLRLEIKRADGPNGTLYLHQYSDPAMQSPVAMSALALHAAVAYRHHHIINQFMAQAGSWVQGELTDISLGMHEAPRAFALDTRRRTLALDTARRTLPLDTRRRTFNVV